jgi:hypothetical protein
MDSSFSPKEEIWFLRVFHHISTGLYYDLRWLTGMWSTQAKVEGIVQKAA